MKDLPKLPTKADLREVIVRANLVARRCAACPPEEPRVRRSDIRKAEDAARTALGYTRDGACATLAKDMLAIATAIDNVMAEIYPVFEMVECARSNGAYLETGDFGYRFYDVSGLLLSSGASLREWLVDHVKRYGEPVTHVYVVGEE